MTAVRDQDFGTEAIREAGLRVTQPRLAVLAALHRYPHARAEQVYDTVRETVPRTSLQSVYNALSDFARVGLVRRIEPAGHPGLFELSTGDNHHHLVCTECGAIEDVACVTGQTPCLAPDDARGYAVDTAEVTFWGRCPRCDTA